MRNAAPQSSPFSIMEHREHERCYRQLDLIKDHYHKVGQCMKEVNLHYSTF